MALEVPAFLAGRGLPDEFVGKRWIDNDEVAILSVLDDTGALASKEALVHFMCFMTKMFKLDHRVLCLEILLRHMDSKLDGEFVNFGGYRLLKRWIHDAEEENNTSLLWLIVQFIRKLPFDSVAIKRAEIGKVIKKLQKYGTSSVDLDALQSEVQALIDDWKEKAIQEKKDQNRLTPKSDGGTPTPARQTATTATTQSRSSITVKPEPFVSMDVEDSQPQPKPAKLAPSPMFATPTPSLSAQLTEVKPLLSLAVNPALAAAALSKPVAPARERKSLDMLEGARKLLAQKAKATAVVDDAMDVDSVVAKPRAAEQKPLLKGGLRKADTAKKEKRNIQWADEAGGLLREVYSIEVEKIKSSVASYKSHKDLVRRERQLEKETYLSKAEEAMQPAIKFVLPSCWSLPIGIVDNMGVATSTDKDKQTRRIAHVLEVRYLDESLIPDDPDYDSTATTAAAVGGDTPAVVVASWYLEHEEAEAAPVLHAGLHGSTAQGHAHGVGFEMRKEDEFNMMVSRLPLPIQMLDPITLQVVVQDAQILQSLILPDGSVEEARLSLLQSCASVDEYRALIFGQYGQMPTYGHMSMYGSGGGGGGGFDHHVDPYSGNMLSNSMQHMQHMQHQQQHQQHHQQQQQQQQLQQQQQQLQQQHQLNWNQQFDGSTWGGSGNMQANASARMGAAGVSRQSNSTTKSSTACRLFNTPRGCSAGNKCPFGHFANNGGGGGGIGTGSMQGSLARSGPGFRGPGSSRGPKRR